MISVARRAGGRTQVSSFGDCSVMHAFTVGGELIGGNFIAAHVHGVSVTARAGCGNVGWVDFGLWIAGCSEVMHAMAINAYCDLGIAGGQTHTVNAGLVFAELIGSQAGIEFAHVGRIGMTAAAERWNLGTAGFAFEAGLAIHGFLRIITVGIASMTANTCEAPLRVDVLREFFLRHLQLIGQSGVAIQT